MVNLQQNYRQHLDQNTACSFNTAYIMTPSHKARRTKSGANFHCRIRHEEYLTVTGGILIHFLNSIFITLPHMLKIMG
jgi:hypothetical protein